MRLYDRFKAKKPISFQIIYRFKTGVTLRFPRVEAIRKDKMWYECLSSTELEKLKSVRIKEGVFKSISEERCFNFEFLPPFLPDYFFVKCSPSIIKGCLIEVCSHGGIRKVLFWIVRS